MVAQGLPRADAVSGALGDGTKFVGVGHVVDGGDPAIGVQVEGDRRRAWRTLPPPSVAAAKNRSLASCCHYQRRFTSFRLFLDFLPDMTASESRVISDPFGC
jgi:hypothetical protein